MTAPFEQLETFLADASPQRLHKFELTPALINAMGYEEVMATLGALSECDLLHLPYPEVALSFCVDDVGYAKNWGNWTADNRKTNLMMTVPVHLAPDDETPPAAHFTVRMRTAFLWLQQDPSVWLILDLLKNTLIAIAPSLPLPPSDLGIEQMCGDLRNQTKCMTGLLLAALATKNVQKTVAVNKRLDREVKHVKPAFKSSDGRVYISRTVLDLPRVVGEATGRRMPFHLRRGHVHTFRRGIGHTETFKKFVPALFVNSSLSDGRPLKPRQYEVA